MVKRVVKKTPAESFEVVLEPVEEGGYHVYAPALKGCHSCGATKKEALVNIAEAIELYLECAREKGCPLPERDRATIKSK